MLRLTLIITLAVLIAGAQGLTPHVWCFNAAGQLADSRFQILAIE